MSSIASAYGIDDATLPLLAAHWEMRNFEGFWNTLRPKEIHREFPYSGFVLTVATVILSQKKLALPQREDEELQSLFDADGPGIVAYGKKKDYLFISEGLPNLEVSDAELTQIFASLASEQWGEAPTALRRAFQFILQAINATDDNEWLILTAG